MSQDFSPQIKGRYFSFRSAIVQSPPGRHNETPSHHLHLPRRHTRRCGESCRSSCPVYLPWRARSVLVSSSISLPSSTGSVLRQTFQSRTGVCDLPGYTPIAKYGSPCLAGDCASGYECHTLERCPVNFPPPQLPLFQYR